QMDFSFTPDEERFREELKAFLAGQLPEDWDFRDFVGEVGKDERAELARVVNGGLADRRWLALPWAEEYGGLAAGQLQQAIFNEESTYARMPGGGGQGVAWVGPAIQQFGSQEQQALWLPRIARGEDTWSTLYTEPGAGSDLASIQTRAERQGDEYVVNGTKIFAAGAQDANMGWLAARTDPSAPKHRGISTFVLPMDAAGVTVRPLDDIGGQGNLNEVSLERSEAHTSELQSREKLVWYQVAETLDLERSGIGPMAAGKRNLERLVAAARDEDSLISRNPTARYELADRWIEMQVGYN